MQSEKIQFISPSFPATSLMAEDYEAIIENNWFSNFGPFEKEFSARLAEYIQNDVQVATAANATSALMMAMIALLPDVKHGRQEVLMPAFTFAAGAESLILLGYTPIFIDINPDTLQPDIKQASNYILSHADTVAGILFCNVFGVGSPDIALWEQLATENKLPLIIDSAAGFGSRYTDGSPLGSRGDCEIFSFHATKPFAIGEGGAIASKRGDIIDRIRELSNFGFSKDRTAHAIGINAKLQELNCAIGLRQLTVLDETLSMRHGLLAEYKKLLVPKGYAFQVNDDQSSVAFVSVIAATQEIADRYYATLVDSNVEVRRYYSPHLYNHPAIKQKSKLADNLGITDSICSRIISLPVHKKISKETVRTLAELAP